MAYRRCKSSAATTTATVCLLVLVLCNLVESGPSASLLPVSDSTGAIRDSRSNVYSPSEISYTQVHSRLFTSRKLGPKVVSGDYGPDEGD